GLRFRRSTRHRSVRRRATWRRAARIIRDERPPTMRSEARRVWVGVGATVYRRKERQRVLSALVARDEARVVRRWPPHLQELRRSEEVRWPVPQDTAAALGHPLARGRPREQSAPMAPSRQAGSLQAALGRLRRR